MQDLLHQCTEPNLVTGCTRTSRTGILAPSVCFDLPLRFYGVTVNAGCCACLVLVSSLQDSQAALPVWLSNADSTGIADSTT